MQVSLENYNVGAKAASDLANTVSGETADDTLRTAGDLASFATRHELVVSEAPSAGDVRDVRRLRTNIREVVRLAHEAKAVDELNGLLAACRADVLLEPKLTRARGYEWNMTVADTSPLGVRVQVLVASGLLATLRILGIDRFRKCEADFCNGVFVDVTRPGRQRFCNPKRCGNRTHVAAHRARTHDQ